MSETATVEAPAAEPTRVQTRERPDHKNVHAAKRAVMEDVGVVSKKVHKRGNDQGLKYPYVSEEDLLEAVQPALVRHGLDITPVAIDVLKSEEYETRSGGDWRYVQLRVTYEIAHGDSDTKVTAVTLGEGTDPGDKAGYKAQTGAYKQLLLKSFAIPTGNDPDHTPSGPLGEKASRPAQTQTQQRPAQNQQPQRAAGATAGKPKFSEAFFRRKAALEKAADADQLARYRQTYSNDGQNSEEEIKELDRIYDGRLKALPRPAATVAGQQPAGNGSASQEQPKL